MSRRNAPENLFKIVERIHAELRILRQELEVIYDLFVAEDPTSDEERKSLLDEFGQNFFGLCKHAFFWEATMGLARLMSNTKDRTSRESAGVLTATALVSEDDNPELQEKLKISVSRLKSIRKPILDARRRALAHYDLETFLGNKEAPEASPQQLKEALFICEQILNEIRSGYGRPHFHYGGSLFGGAAASLLANLRRAKRLKDQNPRAFYERGDEE